MAISFPHFLTKNFQISNPDYCCCCGCKSAGHNKAVDGDSWSKFVCVSYNYNHPLYYICSWSEISMESSKSFAILGPYYYYLWISFCSLIGLHIFHSFSCWNHLLHCIGLRFNYHCCVSIWQHVYVCLSMDLPRNFEAIFLQYLSFKLTFIYQWLVVQM